MPEFTKKRGAGCHRQSEKRAKQVTAVESELKTSSRHVTKRRRRWQDRSSTKCWSKRTAPQQRGEEFAKKVIRKKKGDVEEARNYCPICSLPTLNKLFSTLLCNRLYLDSTSCSRWTREGFWRSYQTLDHLAVSKCGSRRGLHEARWGTNHYGAHSSNVESSHNTSASWSGYTQNTKRQSWQTKRVMCSKQRGNEAGWPIIQFTLRHSSPTGTERRPGQLAKKRHGQMLGWLRIRLPHQPAIPRRRTLVLYIAGTTAEHDVWLQVKHREGRNKNPPAKQKKTQQSKFEQKKRSGDQQHQSRGATSEWMCQVSRTDNNISATGDKKKSSVAFGPPGRRSTDTYRSWHQDHISYSTDFACSMWCADLSDAERERHTLTTPHGSGDCSHIFCTTAKPALEHPHGAPREGKTSARKDEQNTNSASAEEPPTGGR